MGQPERFYKTQIKIMQMLTKMIHDLIEIWEVLQTEAKNYVNTEDRLDINNPK